MSKEVGTSVLLAGAMLSELVAKGSLRVSGLKIGGSPLYYIPGQEARLLEHVKNLNEKDQTTLGMLQEQSILRDAQLDPLTRVSLRQLKDFAIPLEVRDKGEVELFWKYLTVPESEIEPRIKAILGIEEKTPERTEREVRPEKPAAKPAELKQEKPATPAEQDIKLAKPVTKTVRRTEQSKLVQSEPVKELPVVDYGSDAFWNKVQAFCDTNKINILEHHCVKKRAEYSMLVEMPSPVGMLPYLIVAKSRKRISDSDVSSAFVQGQLRKLPVILLSPGEVSKKGLEMCNDLKSVVVKNL